MTPVLKAAGFELGAGTQTVYGAPGTMAMAAGGASQISMQAAGFELGADTQTVYGAPGTIAMAAGGTSQIGMQVLSREEFVQGQIAGASVAGGSVINAAPVMTLEGQQPVTALPTTYGAPATVT